MIHDLKIVILILMVIAKLQSSFARHEYSLEENFTVETNPSRNHIWSYGYYSRSDGSFDMFTFAEKDTCRIHGLSIQGSANNPDLFIIKNEGSVLIKEFGIEFNPGKTTFGPRGNPCVARFTVPKTGLWSLEASFTAVQKVDYLQTEGFVFVSSPNPRLLKGGTVSGTSFTYAGHLTLQEGQTIDFVVKGAEATMVSAKCVRES